jgi:hypothetical protein
MELTRNQTEKTPVGESGDEDEGWNTAQESTERIRSTQKGEDQMEGP